VKPCRQMARQCGMPLTPGKVRCSPASPCSRESAARGSGWFRSSLPLRPAPCQRMLQAGTGKQAIQPNRKARSRRSAPDDKGDIPILENQGTFLFCVDRFDQGLRLADDRVVRCNIRKYMKLIEQNRGLNFWIPTRVQPDTDPAISSGQKVVTIGGILFVLNSLPDNKSAIGSGIVTGIRYAPWITIDTRMVVEFNYSGIHSLHADCSDDNFTLAAGPAYHIGSFEISPKPYFRYRLYADRAYSEEESLRLGATYTRPTYQFGIGADGARHDCWTSPCPASPREVTCLPMSSYWDRFPLEPPCDLNAAFTPFHPRPFRHRPSNLAHRFWACGELPTNIWGAALYREYDGPTLTSSGVRADRYWGGGVSVELDFLNIWGMSPSIGLAYETGASNDPLGRFNRVRALLGIGKVL
jgi:hypothetical protein